MDGKKAALKLLTEHGTMIRHNRHEAWSLCGKTVTITQTKTDERGWLNKLCEIRRILRAANVQFATS